MSTQQDLLCSLPMRPSGWDEPWFWQIVFKVARKIERMDGEIEPYNYGIQVRATAEPEQMKELLTLLELFRPYLSLPAKAWLYEDEDREPDLCLLTPVARRLPMGYPETRAT